LSEDEDVRLIPVSWIKQYHFCPRIVYYVGVLGFAERLTESMVEGMEFHSSEKRKAPRRRTLAGGRGEAVKASWSRLHVASRRLGLYGTIDEVAEAGDGLVVVESKFMRAPRKPPPGHVYQAVAYAMLAEEALRKPARRVVIKYLRDGRSFEVPVTEGLRRHVVWTVSRMRSILEGKAPREADRRKCSSCGYRKVCKGS